MPDWDEMIEVLRKTGAFTEDELESKETGLHAVASNVQRYTIVICFMEEGKQIPTPLGSGVLVRKRDGECGILTAGHVIGSIRNKDIWVVPTLDRSKVPWVTIDGQGMKAEGERNAKQTGPDIGWVPLSCRELANLEALGASFYNRAKEREMTFANGEEIYEFRVTFCAFVEEKSDLNAAPPDIVAVAAFAGKTKEFQPEEGGWDYGHYDFTINDPGRPGTFGGTSGSPVWRIRLPTDGSGRKALILDGVAFAEKQGPDGALIAHGPNSVRKILGEG